MAEIKTNWQPVRFKEDQVTLYIEGHSNKSWVEVEEHAIRYHNGGRVYLLPLDGNQPIEGLEVTTVNVIDCPDLAQEFVQEMVNRALSFMGPELLRNYEVEASGPIFGLDVIGPNPQSSLHLMTNLNGLDNSELSFQFSRDANRILSRGVYDNLQETSFKVQSHDDERIQVQQMQRPELYFTPEGFLRHVDKWEGLTKHGPFSGPETEHKSYEVLVVYPNSLRSSTMAYMGGLKDGMPNVHQGGNYPWEKGWEVYCNFGGWSYEFLSLSNPMDGHATGMCLETYLGSHEGDFDLVFLACQNEESEGQYLAAKATLLGWNIPFEVVHLYPGSNELRQATQIRTTALRAYVKLGGIPWVLPQRKYLGQEVVIGVGCSELSSNTYGFSVLFTRDGLFRLGKSSKYPTKESWGADLGAFVVQQLHELATADNWRDREAVSVVFHLDDALAWEEKEEIRTAIASEFAGQFNILVDFLRVGFRHKFRMWDLERGGGRNGRGTYQLAPGLSYQLDGKRFLICMGGRSEQTNSLLLVEQDPDQGEVDLPDLALQIFKFSHLSYSDFGVGHLPVTLEYGKRLTTALDQFYQAGLGDEVSRALKRNSHPTWFL